MLPFSDGEDMDHLLEDREARSMSTVVVYVHNQLSGLWPRHKLVRVNRLNAFQCGTAVESPPSDARDSGDDKSKKDYN